MKHMRLIPSLLAAGTLVWCLFVGWWIWTTPVRYVGSRSDSGDPAKTVQIDNYERFQDVSGLGAFPLVVPVILAGLATVAACARKTLALFIVALMMSAYGFVTGFSIGGAYLPAGAILLLAAGIAAALRSDRFSEKLARE